MRAELNEFGRKQNTRKFQDVLTTRLRSLSITCIHQNSLQTSYVAKLCFLFKFGQDYDTDLFIAIYSE